METDMNNVTKALVLLNSRKKRKTVKNTESRKAIAKKVKGGFLK